MFNIEEPPRGPSLGRKGVTPQVVSSHMESSLGCSVCLEQKEIMMKKLVFSFSSSSPAHTSHPASPQSKAVKKQKEPAVSRLYRGIPNHIHIINNQQAREQVMYEVQEMIPSQSHANEQVASCSQMLSKSRA